MLNHKHDHSDWCADVSSIYCPHGAARPRMLLAQNRQTHGPRTRTRKYRRQTNTPTETRIYRRKTDVRTEPRICRRNHNHTDGTTSIPAEPRVYRQNKRYTDEPRIYRNNHEYTHRTTNKPTGSRTTTEPRMYRPRWDVPKGHVFTDEKPHVYTDGSRGNAARLLLFDGEESLQLAGPEGVRLVITDGGDRVCYLRRSPQRKHVSLSE